MSGTGNERPRWLTCPVCQVRFCAAESEALPFCSPRCRLVDLGRWLDERYGLPVERDPAGEDTPEEP